MRLAFGALAAIERAHGKNAQRLLQRIKAERANIEAELDRLRWMPRPTRPACAIPWRILKAGNLGSTRPTPPSAGHETLGAGLVTGLSMAG